MPPDNRDFHALLASIHDLTQLDTLLLDGTGLPLGGISLHSVPEELFFSADELRRMASWLALGETMRCVIAATRADLSYVAFWIDLDDADKADQGLLLCGPFLVMPVDSNRAVRALSRSPIPLSLRRAVEDLYEYLPRVEQNYAQALGNAVRSLLLQNLPPIETIEFGSERRAEPTERGEEISLDDQRQIMAFFQAEQVLWNAIKTGDERLLGEIAEASNYFKYFKFRVTKDTLRAAKNLSIGFNEILRLAAFDGGANPILLHKLTWKYVRATESAESAEEIYRLHEIMPYDFLRLVRASRCQDLAPRTKEIVDYIDLHLRGPLCMRETAEVFGLSPQNLAYRFRRDLSSTFTEYVNDKRIKEASWNLRHTGLPIKEIAMLVGFKDVSYFTQLFKAATGMTPKLYRFAGEGSGRP